MYNMELIIGSYKLRLEICLLAAIIFWILWGHLLCSCSNITAQEGFEIIKKIANKNSRKEGFKKNKKEGFKNSSTSAGISFGDSKGSTFYQDPSKWSSPASVFSTGGIPPSGYDDLQNRPSQPIPLPEGELDMFATTKFKPECCPNTYSTGSGCACMTIDQYKYLRNRGSNNVPYSEY